MLSQLRERLKPDESVDHVRSGITPEGSRQPADELADLKLIGDDDAVVVTVFVGVAACFADEVRNVECDKRPAAGNGEVELLTIGCLRMPGLIRLSTSNPRPLRIRATTG